MLGLREFSAQVGPAKENSRVQNSLGPGRLGLKILSSRPGLLSPKILSERAESGRKFGRANSVSKFFRPNPYSDPYVDINKESKLVHD